MREINDISCKLKIIYTTTIHSNQHEMQKMCHSSKTKGSVYDMYNGADHMVELGTLTIHIDQDLLGKTDEVLMVGVHVGQLNVD